MKMTLQNPQEIKVFILFLLEKIGYPLSFNDLGSIVIRDGIVDYFGYFEYFEDLVEAGHIALADDEGTPIFKNKVLKISDSDDGIEDAELTDMSEKTAEPEYVYPKPTAEELKNPQYKFVVTKTGLLIAKALSENILMAAVREKSYASAMRHLSLEKRGAVVDQTFTREGQSYVFKCSVKDKEGEVMTLSLRADTVYQLNRMRLNFDEKPDVIVRGMTALLTGNVDFLFEEDSTSEANEG